MNTQKIGIVAGYSSGRMLAPAFRNRGIACVHIAPEDVPTRLARTYVEKDYEAHFSASANNADQLENLVHTLRAHGVTDVLPGSEIGVPLAWQLRQRLLSSSLPNPEIFYDKWSQTEHLRKSGLRATKQERFVDDRDAITWAREQGLSEVIAKPSASTGSDSVLLCKEPFEESLVRAFHQILGQTNQLKRTNTFVLLQERLKGGEYVVDLVVAGHEIRVAAIFRYEKNPANGAPFVYHSMSTVSFDDPNARKATEFALTASQALVGKNFPFITAIHMELIDACLVEAGFRTHGGQGALMGAEVSGVGQIEMLVDAAIADPRFQHQPQIPNLRSQAREVFLISRQAGRLRRFRNLDLIQSLPSFRRFAPKITAGDPILPTRDLLTSPGSVVLIGQSSSQLDQDEAIIRAVEQEGLFEVDEG